ncbi:MAG: ribonuclease H-like domain-containing protein [Kaiparowitsia implicata GSE-PSE-MK54-09C]|jgi:ribonuclease D|nr:ribonuclease H-like domain-containing protein [Kaiparowitsia implicata GSE-PSE-MK54-09C]
MALQPFQVFDGDVSDEVRDAFQSGEAIAVDTETMGLLPWRDRLCLIQLCDAEGHVAVVRILKGQTEAPNLKRLFEDESVTKIFHFARFDIATLRYNLDIFTTPVFCTKLASKLARTYTPRHGLKDLVMELERVELDKSAQCSDWGNAANLSDEQLHYAANDVRYLISVRKTLITMLEREERLELAYECFSCLPTLVTLDLLQYSNVFDH